MKKVEQAFNKLIFMEMVFSIIFALLGLIIFLKSEMTNRVVGTLMGTFFVISGIMSITSFVDKNKIKLFHYNIIFGILSIIIGIFILFSPLSIINSINIILGIWLTITSINKIVYFIYLKKIKEESNKLFLVSAILLLFLGIMIIVNPFRSIVITKTIGLFIMLYNAVNINSLVLLKRRAKNLLKLITK